MPALDLPVLNRMTGALMARRWLKRSGCRWDVALIYNLAPVQMTLAERLHRAGIPLVFEYEDDAMATLVGGSGANANGARAVATARRIARGALTVNSELSEQLGIPNTATIHGVVSNEAFDFPTRAWSGEPLRILYAGGLTAAKGTDLVLDAVKRLRLPWTLTLTGAGPLARRVSECAAADERIHYLVEVDRDSLHAQMATAHVCVNPHRVDGNQVGTLFPFKIAEYLGFGSRVVSSRLGAMPSALEPGVLIYNGDDPRVIAGAIERVAAEYSKWETGVVAAREYVRTHLSELAVGEVLERILKEARA
jgi:glycosyltransferase involved in cell wall biosynthesis